MKINTKRQKLKTTYQSEKLIENIFQIKTNDDWKNLDVKKNLIVDISNNDYFGIRAFEKKALAIIYNPLWVKNLKRLLKESKKFNTTQFLSFDLNQFDPTTKLESINLTEWFLKETTKIISMIEEITTNNLVLNIINNPQLDLDKIIVTLSTIYQYKIAITTTINLENDYVNFVIKNND